MWSSGERKSAAETCGKESNGRTGTETEAVWAQGARGRREGQRWAKVLRLANEERCPVSAHRRMGHGVEQRAVHPPPRPRGPGLTQKDEAHKGQMRKHPMCQVWRNCVDILRLNACEFGMTPSSRARFEIPEARELTAMERLLQGDE